MTYGSEGRYKVLEFIREFVDENGYPPKYSEIGAGIGRKSLSTIYKHVHSLRREGLIELRRGGRKIKLVNATTCPNCHHTFNP